MIEQHRIDEMTEARTARGRELGVKMGHGITVVTKVDEKRGTVTTDTYDSEDWKYHADCRANLSSSERATFDLEFIKAKQIAGVRASVDLVLAEMRRKLMHRLGKPSWRAG